MMFGVQGVEAIEFPFAESLPKNSDPAIMEEVKEMQQIWQDNGGLVPKAALKEIPLINAKASLSVGLRASKPSYCFPSKPHKTLAM